MLLIIAMIFYTGMEYSFWVGSFTQLLDTKAVGLVMTFIGVGEVLGMLHGCRAWPRYCIPFRLTIIVFCISLHSSCDTSLIFHRGNIDWLDV